MRDLPPFALLGIGLFLLILGVVLPMLMILKFLESTFFWNFLAYLSSFLGLMIGIAGSVMYIGRHRNK